MYKLKTKNSVKKRFRLTSLNKVVTTRAGRRHGMINKSSKFVRIGKTKIMESKSISNVIRKFMPYS